MWIFRIIYKLPNLVGYSSLWAHSQSIEWVRKHSYILTEIKTVVVIFIYGFKVNGDSQGTISEQYYFYPCNIATGYYCHIWCYLIYMACKLYIIFFSSSDFKNNVLIVHIWIQDHKGEPILYQSIYTYIAIYLFISPRNLSHTKKSTKLAWLYAALLYKHQNQPVTLISSSYISKKSFSHNGHSL